MKYLELDARHPECHVLARALVGSQCALSRPAVRAGRIGFELVQPLQDVFLVCRGDENPKWESVTPHRVIFLPLDALKLCPFVAMREGVYVCSEYSFDNTLPDYIDICQASIDTIDRISDTATLEMNGDKYPFVCLDNIELDLDNLPKGARIVEDSK